MRHGRPMIEYEIKRVIEFIDRTRQLFAAQIPLTGPDAHWNIVSHVMRNSLTGQTTTISALIQASGVPYGTASRHVHRLIDEGLLIKQPASSSGRAFVLVASPRLLTCFQAYAEAIKIEMAQALGEPQSAESQDYFLGGKHQLSAATGDHLLSLKTIPNVEHVRFLLHNDFFFLSVRHLWADFRRMVGPARNFTLDDLPGLYARLVENGKLATSRYDIVAIHNAWIGDFASRGLLLPLERQAAAPTGGIAVGRSWMDGEWQGQSYARPIYAAVDLLAVRRDWFEEAGIKHPERPDDIISAGRALHAPRRGRHGIAWNARRGIPIARSFIQLLSGCGVSVVAVFAGTDAEMASRLCTLMKSDAAAQAIDCMRQMLALSPPDILDASSEQTVQTFMSGRAAMCFVWSMHAVRFEIDIRSKVKRRVAYLAQPTARQARTLTPLDGFLLAIPANLPAERVQTASGVLSWLSSPEALRGRMRHGMPISPLFSVTRDPEAAALSPIYATMERMHKHKMLGFRQRPPPPVYVYFEKVIGEEIHDALLGVKSAAQALRSASARIVKFSVSGAA
jgi:multiple sugar transport system substrate-binding protein